jgi:hypothetical protein
LGDGVVVGAEDPQVQQLADVGGEAGELIAGDVELPQVLAHRDLLRHERQRHLIMMLMLMLMLCGWWTPGEYSPAEQRSTL